MSDGKGYMFGWQREFAAACIRRDPSLGAWTGKDATAHRNVGVLAYLAVTATGTTGEGIVVDAEAIAEASGVSVRTIHRAVAEVTAEGWLAVTALAKRPSGRGKRDGSKARYALMTPDTCVTNPCACDTPSHQHRVTRSVRESAGTCDTDERDGGTVFHTLIKRAGQIDVSGSDLSRLAEATVQRMLEVAA